MKKKKYPNRETVYVWGMAYFDKYFKRLDYSPWIRSKKTGRYVSFGSAKGWLKTDRRHNTAETIRKKLLPEKSHKEIFDILGTPSGWSDLMEEASERYEEPLDYFIE